MQNINQNKSILRAIFELVAATQSYYFSFQGCRVRKLEKVRFGKRMRLALYRNRSPLMR